MWLTFLTLFYTQLRALFVVRTNLFIYNQELNPLRAPIFLEQIMESFTWGCVKVR